MSKLDDEPTSISEETNRSTIKVVRSTIYFIITSFQNHVTLHTFRLINSYHIMYYCERNHPSALLPVIYFVSHTRASALNSLENFTKVLPELLGP